MAALPPLAAALASAPASSQDAETGAKLYAAHCVACHGADRAGVAGTFAAPTDVGKRLDRKKIKEAIRNGGGLMPPFGHLSEKDVEDLAALPS
ncbi:cytochrome C [Pseudoxanthomonas broegbernensis]|uniref:Cytochrome C n=1 Tax=Pseudoxanthomonas broegbernensis TaxID=83619 RepID=A0A7V8K6S3_9GAMM|nr:cytochrome c [Pseudoxanthomonas broegbernensis]KAF1686255.1 cytochrome C [Pseudoxanthomonas broegbernensis]MBB6063930.1 quinoprotein glucose dehydrogenase [Pseudoxanthomonas broegbernensis]